MRKHLSYALYETSYPIICLRANELRVVGFARKGLNMKYRIIQLGTGDYQVQKKEGFLGTWATVSCSTDDYNIESKSHDQNNFYWGRDIFPTLELAKKKLKKVVHEREQERLSKEFKVIFE